MISLNAYSGASNTQDVQKQLASMRTYLNVLKSEIENELNHISYENLDGQLRQRLDNIDNSYVQVKKTDTGVVPTAYITAEELNAKFLKKSEGNAKYLSKDTWNQKAITTDNLSSQSIDSSQLVGEISNLLIDLEGLIGSVTGTTHHIKWVSDGNGEYYLKGYDS